MAAAPSGMDLLGRHDFDALRTARSRAQAKPDGVAVPYSRAKYYEHVEKEIEWRSR